jgi:ABC-type multidrug transport system permease subunit
MANSESPKPVVIAVIVVLAISCLLSCSASSSYFSLFATTFSAMAATATPQPPRERVIAGTAPGAIVAK